MYVKECPKQVRYLKTNEKVKFLADGQLYVDYDKHVEMYSKGFCLENFYNPESGEIYMSAFLCKNENASQHLSPLQTSNNSTTVCKFDGDWEGLYRWLRFAFTFCGLFSLPFLFLLLFFYLTLPELCNFQGNIVCAYIISTILTTVFLIVIYNIKLPSEVEIIDTEFFFIVSEQTCQTFGYLLYCSGLLMFSWMSVLCFDLLRFLFIQSCIFDNKVAITERIVTNIFAIIEPFSNFSPFLEQNFAS